MKSFFRVTLLAGLVVSCLAPRDVAAQEDRQPGEFQISQEFRLLDDSMVNEAAGDDELKKLLKARYREIIRAAGLQREMSEGGRGESKDCFDYFKRARQAGLELCSKAEEKVELLTRYVKLMKNLEELVEMQRAGGSAGSDTYLVARSQRIDAEVQLLRAKRELEKGKSK